MTYLSNRLWITFSSILFLSLFLPLLWFRGSSEAAGYLLILNYNLFVIFLLIWTIIYSAYYRSLKIFAIDLTLLVLYFGLTAQFEFGFPVSPPKILFESVFWMDSFFHWQIATYLICGLFLGFEVMMLRGFAWINDNFR